MYEHPIEDIHRLIDTVEEGLRKIERTPTNSIQVEQIPELSEVILELLGWTNTAYMENELGINPSMLSKFVKVRGSVRKHQARKIADRLRSYLKSQPFTDKSYPPTVESEPPMLPPKLDKSVTFEAQSWVAVRITSEISRKIGAIAALLESIIEQTKHANAPTNEQILTEIERQQLIAILQTALNVLKSPLAEKGLLQKARSVLRKGTESAAEKGVQEGLGILMGAARDRLGELINLIFS